MDGITVYTPGNLDMYDSYGLIACELGRHIDSWGVHVNLVPLGERVMPGQPEDVRRVATRPIRMGFGGLLLGYPTNYGVYSSVSMMGPRVALTMFESTVIPQDWVEILNTVDAVIVPSAFCRDVFRESGVRQPIHVVPLGLDDTYQPVARDPDSKPFTFLAFADRGRRKGGHYAIQAFLRAFGDDTDYRLLMKYRAIEGNTPVNILNLNIDAIRGDMTSYELYDLYKEAHVLINANMGEGFGLIPREFAASGGLALATDWGGTSDDLAEWGLPIRVENLIPAWSGHPKFEFESLGVWANPDVEALAVLLRHIADNKEFFMTTAMYKAYEARSRYNWGTCAREVLNIWQGVTDGYSERLRAVAG